MTPEERLRWHRVRAIFDEAAEAEAGPARDAVLDRHCAGDPDLRAEVRKLLEQAAREQLALDAVPAEAARLRDAWPWPQRRAGDLIASRYRITGFIASGGMGEVYAAEDLLSGGAVALKFVRPAATPRLTAEVRARFTREARLAGVIRHPNVCRVLAFEEADGEAYCVMEFIEGETLAARLEREGRMAPEIARGILLQLCAGLHAAHDAGVLHRDMKPGNVLITPEGRAILIDFGLAAPRNVLDHSITAPGAVIGTLAYMAPEQMEDGTATTASDIYALGALAFEMVTGTKPHAAPSPLKLAIERARASSDREPAARLAALPAVWQEVIGRCLRRDPAQRYASARDVAERLACGQPTARFMLRRPRVAAPLAAAAGLALVLMAWHWWRADFVPRTEALVLYRQAQLALAEATPERAVGLLERAIATEPDFLAAGALLAVAHAEAGQLDPARQALLGAAARRDLRWRVGRREAWQLEAARAAVLRDFRGAADRYQRLAQAEAPGLERGLARLLWAGMLEQMGRRAEAIGVLEDLLRESGSRAARTRLARLAGPQALRRD